MAKTLGTTVRRSGLGAGLLGVLAASMVAASTAPATPDCSLRSSTSPATPAPVPW